MSAARERFGAISLSRSSHFAPKVGSRWVKPVRLPPGWARLATKPWATGSLTATKTIGIVRVVRCIAAVAGLATAISTPQQELTWTTQRQITFTSTFQNAITTLTLGFPPSSVSSCTVTRITTLGFFARAFAHSRSIISAFSTSVSRRCMNILHDKWPRGRRTAEHRDELAAPHSITSSARASMVVELLAKVPIATSLGRIGPIPAHVDRLRRRHSIGGDDGAQCDTVKDGPVVGLLDTLPHRPHDRGGFHGHSAAPAHRNMGPTGCDASMSNCDVPGSDRDAS